MSAHEHTTGGDATSEFDLPPELLARLRVGVPGYRLLSVIGEGGQAKVYKATRDADGLTVAVKVLHHGFHAHEHARQRFHREAVALRALDHPNIVRIIDSGQSPDGYDYLVMNYIAGRSLDAFVRDARSDGAGDPTAPLRLFGRICEAVNAAHRCGITHRDLDPSNIRIDDAGEPHILDFGLARSAFDRFLQENDRPISITDQFLGKIAYASPEQARGQPDAIDIRTDVYALGVILYRIVTNGEFPYAVAGNIADVLHNIIYAQPTPPSRAVSLRQLAAAGGAERPLRRHHPPAVNAAIEAIVMKALQKDRALRYQDAGELGRDIDAYLTGRPTVASLSTTDGPAANASRERRPHVGRTAVRVAAVLLALGAAFLAARVAWHRFGPWHRPASDPAVASGVAASTLPTSRPVQAIARPFDATASSEQRPASPSTNPARPASRPVTPNTNGVPVVAGTVDLLTLVNPEKDAVHGTWRMTGGALVADAMPYARIEFPYVPPVQYDYRIVFNRSSGHESIDHICSADGRQFCWVLGGLRNRVSGFELLDGRGFHDNQTSRRSARWINNGERYTSIVKVRRDHVEAWLDGRIISSWAPDVGSLLVFPGKRLRRPDTVGILVFNSETTIEVAEIIELLGRGERLR